MKKTLVMPLAAAFTLFILMGLGGSKESVQSATSGGVGVIKLQEVYSSSKVGTAALAYLEGLEKQVLDKYNDLTAKAEAAKEAEDQALIDRLQVELQAFSFQIQTLMSKEQERIIEIIAKTVQSGLDAYREKSGLGMILTDESVQSFAPSFDVTAAALESVDAQTFDFGDYPNLDLAGGVPSNVILPDDITEELTSKSEAAATAE